MQVPPAPRNEPPREHVVARGLTRSGLSAARWNQRAAPFDAGRRPVYLEFHFEFHSGEDSVRHLAVHVRKTEVAALRTIR
jgi:hypothetical protein